ncbi:MAG TPA: hypothetical protein VE377_01315 [Candidatus Dormibacteraeota bacterium]|nr:hypothetical protein [Candidatus Dormibacteraeota bacterium]
MDAIETTELNDVIRRVMRGVRSFGKVETKSLSSDIEFLRRCLSPLNVGDMFLSTASLQAVSLVFDYEDQHGGAFSKRLPVLGELLFKNRDTRVLKRFHDLAAGEVRTKWMRQIIWVMMAHALWCHRKNDLDKMDRILGAAKNLLDETLLREADRPGTLARWNYYRGLQLRDQGDLDGATACFVESFERARERHSQRASSPSRNNDLEVEEAFTRACLARIQAFGFGEVAFFKGDLAHSAAWFRTALTTLEGAGLNRWKLSVKVYLFGSQVLNSPLTKEGENRIAAAKEELRRLAVLLKKLHLAYSNLAQAFANLGQVRLAQIRDIVQGGSGLQVDISLPVDDIPDGSPGKARIPADGLVSSFETHGAISALISSINGEIFLRTKCLGACQEEINRIRRDFPSYAFAQVEAELLQAQLYIFDGHRQRAEAILNKDPSLDYRTNRTQRALWFALACLLQFDLKRTLLAHVLADRARSVGKGVGDGFVQHVIALTSRRLITPTTSVIPMPYQGEPPNFSIDDNLDAAYTNMIRSALRSKGLEGVKDADELALVLGVSRPTVYKKIPKRILGLFFKEVAER